MIFIKCLAILIFLINIYINMTNFITKKIIKIEKRIRFVISAILLTICLFISTLNFFDKAIIFIPILTVVCYGLTYFAVLEGIEKIEWLTLFIIPVLLTIAFYLFYFLFPARWLTRLPFLIIYAISIYGVLLCSNIFNVGVEKNLQLYRAAFSINFFYHTFIAFLIFNLIFTLRQNFLINGFLVGGISLVLSVHLFWVIKLKEYIEKESLIYALFVVLILVQLTMVLSFMPLNSSIFALILTAFFYCLSGLTYSFIDQRLFKETIREYLIVLGFVFVIALLSVNW